ncbi:MAG: GTP cyclohydrolase I FolE [Gammaproteobacteria bacterium]|nr:MAG: GTP cyclohydrolase I FolE [Gammaproteobacteria bacterium]
MSDKKTSRPSQDEAETAIRTLLWWIGEDADRPGVKRTPARVLGAYGDWFAGYAVNPHELLGNSFQAVKNYKRIVTLCDIDFSSHCEHHMAPFIGRIHIAYLPNERLVGISKLVRVVEAYTKRLQVQERLTGEIAACIDAALQPRGVAVVVEAQHQCMTTRGVNKTRIKMVTQEMLGAFEDDDRIRNEFLNAIRQSAD